MILCAYLIFADDLDHFTFVDITVRLLVLLCHSLRTSYSSAVLVGKSKIARIVNPDRRFEGDAMGDIWQAARANNVKRVKVLLDGGTSPDATRWVRSPSIYRRAFYVTCFSRRK